MQVVLWQSRARMAHCRRYVVPEKKALLMALTFWIVGRVALADGLLTNRPALQPRT